MKKCPYCAEEIQDEAIKCRHCDSFLNQEEKQVADENSFTNQYQITIKPKKKSFIHSFPVKLPHKVFLDENHFGNLRNGEIKIPVLNGIYKIKLKYETWRSNTLEIEINDNNIDLEWGSKTITLPFTEGLWIKQIQ